MKVHLNASMTYFQVFIILDKLNSYQVRKLNRTFNNKKSITNWPYKKNIFKEAKSNCYLDKN